jgi:hypothetical protein
MDDLVASAVGLRHVGRHEYGNALLVPRELNVLLRLKLQGRGVFACSALAAQQSILQFDEHVRRPDDRRVVGREDEGHSGPEQPPDRREHTEGGARVQLSRRLVGYDQPRAGRQDVGERCPLLLTAREL